VFINWLQDGIDAEDPVPVQLQADPGAFGAALEAKGVSHEKAVVVRGLPACLSYCLCL
jgi:hypothetical protein